MIASLFRGARYLPVGALLIAAALQGCVSSQVPLLDESTAIADPSFTGRYRISGVDKLPSEMNVFLKDKKYVLVVDPKHFFVATLHRRPDDIYLVQMRATGVSSEYNYFLLRKSPSGFELNLIPCDANCNSIHDLDGLNAMADNAASHFNEKGFAQAEKLAELGR